MRHGRGSDRVCEGELVPRGVGGERRRFEEGEGGGRNREKHLSLSSRLPGGHT